MNANRVDGSPAYALLTDMSNRGVTYDQVVMLLKKLSHKLALQELGYKGELMLPRDFLGSAAFVGVRESLL